MKHRACTCGMVLVLITVDGQQVLACPRATCVEYGRPVE